MQMLTHFQVGINLVINYMQSNLWRISAGGCFQKAGSAFPGFILGWIRVDHMARFLCCYFFVLFIFLLCRMCPMLPVPVDLLFLIAPSIYSYVYSHWLKHHYIACTWKWYCKIIQIEDHSLHFNKGNINIDI